MPELPEVETVRRGLRPVLEGHVLTDAIVRRPDLRWKLPDLMAKRLRGRGVNALKRRAKYLLAELDDGYTWLIHLGMSGRMTIFDTPPIPEALTHDHVEVKTDRGAVIRFNDPRRFGAMDLIPTEEVADHKLIKALGPEPLGNRFDEAHMKQVFTGKKTSLKSALLDQRLIAGLGNIYVCEALFRAGLNPDRPAGGLTARKRVVLVSAIKAVLTDAIAAGGSSLKDHRQANGELGYFQHNFKVYGREGQGCAKAECTGVIVRKVHSGRSTFFCPICQD